MANPLVTVTEFDSPDLALEMAMPVGTSAMIQRVLLQTAAEGVPVRHGGWIGQRSADVNIVLIELRAEYLVWGALLHAAAKAFLERLGQQAADRLLERNKRANAALAELAARPVERLAESIVKAAAQTNGALGVKLVIRTPNSLLEIEHNIQSTNKVEVATTIATVAAAARAVGETMAREVEQGAKPTHLALLSICEDSIVVTWWDAESLVERQTIIRTEATS